MCWAGGLLLLLLLVQVLQRRQAQPLQVLLLHLLPGLQLLPQRQPGLELLQGLLPLLQQLPGGTALWRSRLRCRQQQQVRGVFEGRPSPDAHTQAAVRLSFTALIPTA